MKIAIIGSGWLGLPLAECLHKAGVDVSLSYRSSKPGTELPTFTYPGPDAAAILKDADCIVLAFPPSRERLEKYGEDCLEVVKSAHPQARFILTSSTSVYPDKAIVMTEETSLTEENTGNLRIRTAEKTLQEILGKRLTIIRLGGLIGPERYPVTAMSRTGKQYVGDEPLNVLHLDDAIGLTRFAIENELSGIINGCSPEHPTKEAYYTWMARQLNCPVPDLSGRTNGGKTISSAKSIALGYVYQRPDPYDFF